MPPSLLALDFGTSSLHCMVADADGRPIADCHAPIRYVTPDGESELAREFHPQKTLQTASQLIARTLSRANVPPDHVSAIGITGQRHGIVFLDDNHNELLVSPNVDLRAAFEGATLQEEMGDSLYESTGQFPAMLLAPAKLRWLENNRPAKRKRVKHVLTIAGWLALNLTGIPACEPSLAAGIGLLDPATVNRNNPTLSRMGVSPSLLPSLTTPGNVIGTLRSSIARQCGLPPNTPVTLAGADSSSGLVGMGLTRPADTALVAGWSATIQTLTGSPKADPQARAWFSPSPIPGRWASETNLGDAGNAHRWLKNLALGPESTFSDADALAATATVGSNDGFAYLGPAPQTAPEAGLGRGGLLFPTPFQFREPTPADILRSFWECLAFAIKANLTTLERASNITSPVLHLGGGMARSSLFAQILADVTGKKVRRCAPPHVSLMGAVAAAAVAAGLQPNLTKAAVTFAPQWIEVGPDPSDTLEYEDYYQQWKLLYHRVQDS